MPSTPSLQGLPPPSLLEALVRVASPTDHEEAAVAWFADVARADGFRVEEDEAGNFIAEAGEGGPVLWFVGHIDTVPGDLEVKVEDGVLWGRGSVDAKGPLVAAYCAAREWVGRSGLRIRVIGCVDEEGGSRGARVLEGKAPPDWFIVGEPNEVDAFALGYKGVVRGTLSVDQDRLHASAPGAGACEVVWRAWQRFLDTGSKGDGFDDLHARIIRFDGGERGERDVATAYFDVRFPPAITPEQAADMVRAAAAPVAVEITEMCPAALVSGRTDLAAALRSAIRATGYTPRVKRKTATADFNLLVAYYPDVPAVVYGPGDSHLDHGPHERLPLADLEGAVEILSRTFATLAASRSG